MQLPYLSRRLLLILLLPLGLAGQEVIRDWTGTTLIVTDIEVEGTIAGNFELEFESVAEMKAYDFSNTADGARIKCNGYNTANDGYFGPDVFWDEDNTDADNGLTVFDPTIAGDGRLVRSFEIPVNIRWAGAKANDATFDNRAIFQTAVTYCADNNVILQGNPDTYYLEETGAASNSRAGVTYRDYVEYKGGFTFHGNGIKLTTQYQPATSATQAVFFARDESEATVDRVHFQDISFEGTGGQYYVTGIMFNGTNAGAEGNFTFPSASGINFVDMRGGINIFGYGTGGGAGGEDVYQMHHATIDNITSEGSGSFVVNCNSGRNITINNVVAERLSADIFTISGGDGVNISNVSAVAARDTNDFGDLTNKTFDGCNVVLNNNGKHVRNVTLSNVNIYGGPVSFRSTDNGGANAYTHASLDMHNITLNNVIADRIQIENLSGGTTPIPTGGAHDIRYATINGCLARNNVLDASQQGTGAHTEPSKRGYYFYYLQDLTLSGSYARDHTWQGALIKNCLDVQINGLHIDKTNLANINSTDHNECGILFEDTNRIQVTGIKVFKTEGYGLAFTDCDQVTGSDLWIDGSGPAVTATSITAFADAGGGQVTVTSAGHGLGEDVSVIITGTTNYNGTFTATNVTTDTFEITDTWVSDDATGTATANPDSAYANYNLYVADADDVILTGGRLNSGETGLYLHSDSDRCTDTYFSDFKWRDQSSKYIDYAESTGSITAFADAGGGQVTVTSAGHGLEENASITITGTTNYNGSFTATSVTTDTFEITDTWVSDDATGTWYTEITKWNVRNPDYSGLTYSSSTVNFLNDPLNTAMGIDLQAGAGVDLTLPAGGTGVIQIERSFHQLEENADTSDVVITINHGVKGQIVAFQIASSNAITFQHAGGGNIRCNSGANTTISNTFTVIRFFFDGSNWIEMK